jgi:organic hydroperoxide reductase OsmC/OhrA
MKTHDYSSRLIWDGNLGEGTATYTAYSRNHHFELEGKPNVPGSADPMFRGDADRYNPEDLFLMSLSSCHLLTYLHLCAVNKIKVLAYEDQASGTLVLDSKGGGKFESVTLHPAVTIAPGDDEKKALELHHKAHELCFIAASVSIPVHHEPTIMVGKSADLHDAMGIKP